MWTRIFRKSFASGIGMGLVAGILIVVGALFVAYKTLTYERPIKAPLMPSQNAADYEWSVRSLDGRELNMAAVKGKVVFLNVWATWCSPCRREMASIQRLYEKLKDEGVVFVAVSKEDSTTVSRFLEDKSFSFPIYTLQGELPAAFAVDGIPTTFILSPDGKIALGHEGAAIWDDDGSVTFIRSLKPRS